MSEKEHEINREHAHSHDHSTVPFLDIDRHEHALVGTVRIRIPGIYEIGVAVLEDAMRGTAAAIEEAGGLIGHIKAYVREEGRTAMVSVTEAEDLQRREQQNPCVYAEIASIVFGVEEEALEQLLRKFFGEWME